MTELILNFLKHFFNFGSKFHLIYFLGFTLARPYFSTYSIVFLQLHQKNGTIGNKSSLFNLAMRLSSRCVRKPTPKICSCHVCDGISGWTIGWKFLSIDAGKSIFAFMFVVGQFICMYAVLTGIFLLRHKFGAIFDNLSAIYKASKCTTQIHLEIKLNQSSNLIPSNFEFRWKYRFISIFGTC